MSDGEPVCYAHNWVGDEECAYCRIDELQAELARSQDRVTQLEASYDELRTVCNRQQSRLHSVREQAENWTNERVKNLDLHLAGVRILALLDEPSVVEKVMHECDCGKTFDLESDLEEHIKVCPYNPVPD